MNESEEGCGSRLYYCNRLQYSRCKIDDNHGLTFKHNDTSFTLFLSEYGICIRGCKRRKVASSAIENSAILGVVIDAQLEKKCADIRLNMSTSFGESVTVFQLRRFVINRRGYRPDGSIILYPQMDYFGETHRRPKLTACDDYIFYKEDTCYAELPRPDAGLLDQGDAEVRLRQIVKWLSDKRAVTTYRLSSMREWCNFLVDWFMNKQMYEDAVKCCHGLQGWESVLSLSNEDNYRVLSNYAVELGMRRRCHNRQCILWLATRLLQKFLDLDATQQLMQRLSLVDVETGHPLPELPPFDDKLDLEAGGREFVVQMADKYARLHNISPDLFSTNCKYKTLILNYFKTKQMDREAWNFLRKLDIHGRIDMKNESCDLNELRQDLESDFNKQEPTILDERSKQLVALHGYLDPKEVSKWAEKLTEYFIRNGMLKEMVYITAGVHYAGPYACLVDGANEHNYKKICRYIIMRSKFSWILSEKLLPYVARIYMKLEKYTEYFELFEVAAKFYGRNGPSLVVEVARLPHFSEMLDYERGGKEFAINMAEKLINTDYIIEDKAELVSSARHLFEYFMDNQMESEAIRLAFLTKTESALLDYIDDDNAGDFTHYMGEFHSRLPRFVDREDVNRYWDHVYDRFFGSEEIVEEESCCDTEASATMMNNSIQNCDTRLYHCNRFHYSHCTINDNHGLTFRHNDTSFTLLLSDFGTCVKGCERRKVASSAIEESALLGVVIVAQLVKKPADVKINMSTSFGESATVFQLRRFVINRRGYRPDNSIILYPQMEYFGETHRRPKLTGCDDYIFYKEDTCYAELPRPDAGLLDQPDAEVRLRQIVKWLSDKRAVTTYRLSSISEWCDFLVDWFMNKQMYFDAIKCCHGLQGWESVLSLSNEDNYRVLSNYAVELGMRRRCHNRQCILWLATRLLQKFLDLDATQQLMQRLSLVDVETGQPLPGLPPFDDDLDLKAAGREFVIQMADKYARLHNISQDLFSTKCKYKSMILEYFKTNQMDQEAWNFVRKLDIYDRKDMSNECCDLDELRRDLESDFNKQEPTVLDERSKQLVTLYGYLDPRELSKWAKKLTDYFVRNGMLKEMVYITTGLHHAGPYACLVDGANEHNYKKICRYIIMRSKICWFLSEKLLPFVARIYMKLEKYKEYFELFEVAAKFDGRNGLTSVREVARLPHFSEMLDYERGGKEFAINMAEKLINTHYIIEDKAELVSSARHLFEYFMVNRMESEAIRLAFLTKTESALLDYIDDDNAAEFTECMHSFHSRLPSHVEREDVVNYWDQVYQRFFGSKEIVENETCSDTEPSANIE